MAWRSDNSVPRKTALCLESQIAFRLGLSAESRAAALLVAKGYRIAARRWKSSVGEIDIVARRKQLLLFVEVKARAARRCGGKRDSAPATAGRGCGFRLTRRAPGRQPVRYPFRRDAGLGG